LLENSVMAFERFRRQIWQSNWPAHVFVITGVDITSFLPIVMDDSNNTWDWCIDNERGMMMALFDAETRVGFCSFWIFDFYDFTWIRLTCYFVPVFTKRMPSPVLDAPSWYRYSRCMYRCDCVRLCS
jgi:hypothetical protein